MTERYTTEDLGSRLEVRHEFLILHSGWAGDNIGWVTDAGVFTTNHGGARLYPMGADERPVNAHPTLV